MEQYRMNSEGKIYTLAELRKEHRLHTPQYSAYYTHSIWKKLSIVKIKSEEERKVLQEKMTYLYKKPEKTQNELMAEMVKKINDAMIWGGQIKATLINQDDNA